MNTIPEEHARRMLAATRAVLEGEHCPASQLALEWMTETHTGLRRDRITPVWAHPLRVAAHLITLLDSVPPSHRDPLIASALLHDLIEDYPYAAADIEVKLRPAGADVAAQVALNCEQLSHSFCLEPQRGRQPSETYYAGLLSPEAPLVKAGDRIHNMHSMHGIFKPQRALAYAAEARDQLLPALQRHRRAYPLLRRANLNLTYTLECQIAAVCAQTGAATS